MTVYVLKSKCTYPVLLPQLPKKSSPKTDHWVRQSKVGIHGGEYGGADGCVRDKVG